MTTENTGGPIKTCPHTYEANKEPFHQHLTELLPQILDQMEWGENELILDHGCSTGSTCIELLAPKAAATNSTIYGLDICGEMINYAKEHNPHPNVKYVQGTLTAKDSPVKGLKFNKIFSVYTLLFVEDHKKELEALYEYLAPGGDVFFVFKLESHQFNLLKSVKDEEKWAPQANCHLVIPGWVEKGKAPEDILKQDFQDVGFEIKSISKEEENVVFKNPQEFADLIFSQNSFARNLPKDDYQLLKDKYRMFICETETKRHSPNPNSANEPYTMCYQSLRALLKKPK